MDLDTLFRIAGVGLLTTVVAAILNRAGREELATLSTIAGLAIVLLMVVGLIADLLSQVRSIFQLY